ncbi:efflux RND transporter periplasmic adaptor subunit [Gilvimarinus sp. F26214L]|uniref:efflux RND transporter periplasmic adaptor subunit n=1 Tax=Gilvimarinus sp. DZF01 TaxID=3461371 RepID=UPI004045C4F4
MKMSGKHLLLVTAGIAAGVVGTLVIGTLGSGDEQGATAKSEREPLYWVAPMDANYRRDKPGKSPMGMDLVPVYEEEQEPGLVKISPDVVNNLGVRTATVKRGELTSRVKTVGYIQYDQDQLLNLDPRVEGWIEKLYVTAEGDPVSEGDPLYTLYSPTLVNAQEELVLALNRGNEGLIKGATERLQALRVPQQTIEALRKNRQVLQNITVYAPKTGVVSDLQVREGSFVKPSDRLMSIGVLDQVWVAGEVFERQLPLVNEGDPVIMELDYIPSREWHGEVDYIYPSISPETRTAQIRVRMDNADHALKPGMFAQLSIAGRHKDSVLLIPREALIRTGSDSRVVLARGEGKFKSVNVEVGRIVGRQVEILAGLEEGDRIVTSAQFLIDSESSKSSDFQRMDHDDSEPLAADQKQSIWVAAKVESAMPEHSMVTLAHEAIPQWEWPAMVMDFSLSEDVDPALLTTGARVEVQLFQVGEGDYLVTAVRPKSDTDAEVHPQPSEPISGRDHADHEHGAHQ